ncbi:hypothetical protein [Cupriavidus basilensis]|uniref:hypothetical protein n=1 Tax=Cupriavidus basilensis TaxID=68895 RepID=UPI0002D484DF|nr:hypothetical protein [Cupriavidus basilensis]
MPAAQHLQQTPARLTTVTFDQWREAIDTSFLPLDYSRQTRGGFHCHVSYARFGASAVADMDVDAHRVARESRHVAAPLAGARRRPAWVAGRCAGRARRASRCRRLAPCCTTPARGTCWIIKARSCCRIPWCR